MVAPFTQEWLASSLIVLQKILKRFLGFFFHCFAMISSWIRVFSFITLKYPLPKDDLCHVWLKLASDFGEAENVKNLRTDRQWTTENQKSSLKLSAQVKLWQPKNGCYEKHNYFF
jgi:oligoendopeptidase F